MDLVCGTSSTSLTGLDLESFEAQLTKWPLCGLPLAVHEQFCGEVDLPLENSVAGRATMYAS